MQMERICPWILVANGEVVDRNLHLARRLATFNQLINFQEYNFINPNLAAGSADLDRDVLEEVEPIAAAFLVGDCGCFYRSATDSAKVAASGYSAQTRLHSKLSVFSICVSTGRPICWGREMDSYDVNMIIHFVVGDGVSPAHVAPLDPVGCGC